MMEVGEVGEEVGDESKDVEEVVEVVVEVLVEGVGGEMVEVGRVEDAGEVEEMEEVVEEVEEVEEMEEVGLVVVVMVMVVSGWDLSRPPMRSLTDWMTLSTLASWTLSTGYLGVLAGPGEERRQSVLF